MYTYKVYIIPTSQYYIGAQYKKKANPEDLGRTYFTSSSLVQSLIFEYGKGNIHFEIDQLFEFREDCSRREYYLIKNSRDDVLCLNRQNGTDFKKSIKQAFQRGSYVERDRKQSERMKSLWQNDNFREKMMKNRSKTHNMTTEARVQKSIIMKDLHSKGLCTYDNTSNTKWINNGIVNVRIKNTEILPNGFVFGRTGYKRSVK